MKFSIRDLLLVTVIVAVCVAWWIDHRRQVAAIEQLTHPVTTHLGFRLVDIDLAPNPPAKK
jgi:hypothetical protein